MERTKCPVCVRQWTYSAVCFNCRIDADDNPNKPFNNRRREFHRQRVRRVVVKAKAKEEPPDAG